MLQYLERCNRFEKTADARLKEIRLMQASVREDSAADLSVFVSKNKLKKRNNKERNKKAQVKEEGEHLKKKSRTRRLEKNDTFFEELAELEAPFFQTVKKVKRKI